MDRRPSLSEHYDGERFVNTHTRVHKTFFEFLKWQLLEKKTPWPKWRDNTATPAIQKEVSVGSAAITFVNHATHLIQLPGLNILTDPVYSERVSPFTWAGPKRVREPGVPFEMLPRIHIVLISHNHYDHMDSNTIHRLAEFHNPLFLTPLENARLILPMGARQVMEQDWWDTAVAHGARITLVPAQHWSARGTRDRNLALWGGFVVEKGGVKVYFAGDTGYCPHFKEIHQAFGPMDVSLLPIGAYEPRWFMHLHHMNPEDAVLAHMDLQSKLSLGSHFGTFRLTDEGIDTPLEALKVALESHKIPANTFLTPEHGETVLYAK